MGFKDIIQNLVEQLPTSQKLKSAIGLDIGSSTIKVVQMRKEKGKAVLETYGEIALGPYASLESGKITNLPEDKIAEALQDLFAEANVSTNQVSLTVPFTYALSKVIKVPKMSKEKLKTVVPIEARKYVPMPLNEVMLDWFVLPKASYEDESENRRDGLEFIDILLVAVHKDAVARLQRIMKLSNLEVAFYELEAFASARSTVEYDIVPQMLVDIGASSTKVYIIDSGVVRFSHMANYGSQNITENLSRAMSWSFEKAERIKKERGIVVYTGSDRQEAELSKRIHDATMVGVNRILADVSRVLLSFEKKHNKSVSKIIMTGGGANMPGFVEFAEKKLAVPVVKADPFSKAQAPAFLEQVLKDIGPDFSSSVGLVLRHINS